MLLRKDRKISSNFSEIIISLASPEVILERSYGEVTQPETVHYKTHKPEMNGLFCERIFGPVKDWECHCGKYKGIRYRSIICDRCGVEITEKKARRERVGHIELVVPVAHIWYFRSLPNKISSLLGLSTKTVDQVIYYERYIVIQPGIKQENGINPMDLLTEEEYLDIIEQLPAAHHQLSDNDPQKFIAKMGSEALEILLTRIEPELDSLSFELRNQIATDTSQQRKADLIKRLRIIDGFRDANKRIVNKASWMILRILPVIPPELRPLVYLSGGKFANSDLNDLYRRVIIRNNRLRRLIDIKAPGIIIRNEQRMLQEAVDSLLDNSRRVNAVASEGMRPLKSLSDMLKGKQGRFRQNLLGKRVDYSGRSVIVAGPNLALYECGLPKDMALELFMPFVIRRLLERGITQTVKLAKKVIEKKEPVVWDILENTLKGHPVLLNRAPTLHRLGIQAFQPKLIEGKAIQLHPLVCAAFNADFDGDQMAVHVPLSQEAITEAALLMLSSHNILNPANGLPIIVPSKDIVLGLYYITKGRKSTPEHPVPGEGKFFYGSEEVMIALANGKLSKHAHIKLRIQKKNEQDAQVEEIIDTVAGRVLFNQYCPEEIGFINEVITSKKIQSITAEVYRKVDTVRTTQFLDDIKELGFHYAYKGGISISLEDIKVPLMKGDLVAQTKQEVDIIWGNYLMGLITDSERYNQVIDAWARINTRITNLLMEQLEQEQQGFNAVYMMMHSGARGSREQLRQLGGMRGLMGKPRKSLHGSVGEIIESPIVSNFKEGLDVTEYFISTHGARKGLADTSLKTADAGYLTRRLVDVAQDLVITEKDCGALTGLVIRAVKNDMNTIEPLFEKILGRVALYDIYDPTNTTLLVRAGEEITESIATEIDKVALEAVEVRSVLTCELRQGVCIKCYGRNLAVGKLATLGDAVGITAAQSIGEPGTQLTMRTFHVGGTASNIAVEAKVQAKLDGIVTFLSLNVVNTPHVDGQTRNVVMGRSSEIRLIDPVSKKIVMTHHLPYGAYINVAEGERVKKGQELCYWDPYNAVILATVSGTVEFEGLEEGITYKEEYDEQTGHKSKVIIESKDKTKNPSIVIRNEAGDTHAYTIPVKAYLVVEEGQYIHQGQALAKILRIMSKSKDITGGLPRVIELFEARNPSNTAILSEINGSVIYSGIKRGNREIFVEAKEKVKRKYLIPLSKHILVQDHDYVKIGESLSEGTTAAGDILAIEGPLAVQKYLTNELQEVYRLQGVKINNKHIEIIIRQMMRKVEILESGDTHFLFGQIVDKFIFWKANDKIQYQKVVIDVGDSQKLRLGQCISTIKLTEENNNLKNKGLQPVQVRAALPAIAKPKLQGITQAALSTESFLSAASFQETPKLLSEAAIQAKIDRLQGLKENVIVGHKIPAGTGSNKYKNLIVSSKKEYEELVDAKQRQRAPGG